MAKLCAEDNIAMTPYSALAGGRLSRHPGETSRRLEEDSYAKFKYDATARQDNVIINRVAELAERRGVSMTEISLAWLLTKVTAPVVGATKRHHIEGAARAVELTLTPEETAYLEEAYIPHKLVGVMAQNTPAAAREQHVWDNPKFCVKVKCGANRVKFIMGDRRVIGCRLINNITPVGRDVKAKLSYPPLPSI